jgi:DNA-binding MarR family transcriptional regulator
MSTELDELGELGVALERVASWIRRAARPDGWNSVAMSTLDHLARSGPQRVSDLVAQERITQPGMTSVVTRLAAAGFVTRAADPSDGRATLVSATDAGRAYLREFHARRARTVAAHLRALPDGELRALLAATGALDRLAGRPITQPTHHTQRTEQEEWQ